MNIEGPLVSVCIITYNSADFILETLESAKAQTYSNIELIVSDDCSKDNTVEVCNQWMCDNRDRFVNCKVITTPINTGVAANLNRGIAAAEGEWIKSIAGDDILTDNCIEDYIAEAKNHPDEHAFFSLYNTFCNKNGINEFTSLPEDAVRKLMFFSGLTAKEQYRELLACRASLPASTAFIRRSLLVENPYNEKYKYMEDYPMWVYLTSKGMHLFVSNIIASSYRIHESLSQNVASYYSPRYFETKHLYFWNEKRQYYLEEQIPEGYDTTKKTLLINELIDGLTHNKVSRINNIKVRLVYFFVNHFIKFQL